MKTGHRAAYGDHDRCRILHAWVHKLEALDGDTNSPLTGEAEKLPPNREIHDPHANTLENNVRGG